MISSICIIFLLSFAVMRTELELLVDSYQSFAPDNIGWPVW